MDKDQGSSGLRVGVATRPPEVRDALMRSLRAPVLPPSTEGQPLFVASYSQQLTGWCNLVALTDLVNAHIGRWPAGGLGSVWGESGPWYLAGLSGQGREGVFWEDTLRAAGLLDSTVVPGGFPASFENDFFEYRAWMFNNSTDSSTWSETWLEFRRYVYAVTHGTWRAGHTARPLAIGAHHTRVIAGSSVLRVFISEPGGGYFVPFSWDGLLNEVNVTLSRLAPDDVSRYGFGTIVLKAPLRPADERHGALWLMEAENREEQGAICLRRQNLEQNGYWRWGGVGGRRHGYWFDDVSIADELASRALPLDEVFGHTWNPQRDDVLECQCHVQNLTRQERTFRVEVELRKGDWASGFESLGLIRQMHAIAPARRVFEWDRALVGPLREKIGIDTLPAGAYTVTFTLFEGDLQQDRKHIGLYIGCD